MGKTKFHKQKRGHLISIGVDNRVEVRNNEL